MTRGEALMLAQEEAAAARSFKSWPLAGSDQSIAVSQVHATLAVAYATMAAELPLVEYGPDEERF